jgi:hypothetical protein
MENQAREKGSAAPGHRLFCFCVGGCFLSCPGSADFKEPIFLIFASTGQTSGRLFQES